MTRETFVDAATHVCLAAVELDMRAGVMLHRTHGPAGLVIDNLLGVTDELRRWNLSEDAWQRNPVMIDLRRQLAVLGPDVIDRATFTALARENGYVGISRVPVAIPLLGPSGWFGTVVCGTECALSVEVERQLAQLVTELSVWCTARGISTLPDVRPLAPRQHEVAQLAAAGRTNPEIADELAISVNTVKLRLKQVFERLGVANRTELASVLRRLAPLDGIPPGISRRGAITITRDEVAG